MAKTTIGEFLAILRKSKGYTQQEAADRLGVSNKTVSSWETGASSPDISMLPAIAELYGVTCDELLRGERISPAEPPQATEQKREKALSHLLARYSLSLFVTLLACRRAVFLVSQEDFEAESTERFFVYLFRVRGRVCIACAAAFGFIFPHVFVPAHWGLSINSSFLYGTIGAAVAFAGTGFIYLLLKSKSTHFTENERKFLRYRLFIFFLTYGIAILIAFVFNVIWLYIASTTLQQSDNTMSIVSVTVTVFILLAATPFYFAKRKKYLAAHPRDEKR